MLPLVGRDGRDLGRRLGVVRLLLVALERLDEVAHGVGPEEPGDLDDEADPQPRRARFGDVGALLAQLAAQIPAWRRSLPAIVPNARARRSSFSIAASASYRAIASRSSFRLIRLWAMSVGLTLES